MDFHMWLHVGLHVLNTNSLEEQSESSKLIDDKTIVIKSAYKRGGRW